MNLSVALDAPTKDTKEIPSQAIIIKTRGGKRSGRSLTDGEKGEGRSAATRGSLSLRVRNCRDYGYVSSVRLGAHIYAHACASRIRFDPGACNGRAAAEALGNRAACGSTRSIIIWSVA